MGEHTEHLVLRPLSVEKVTAIYYRAGLEFSVDAAVALFHAGRVPWDIKVDEVMAVGLEVKTFAGGIGADEYPHGVFIWRSVEGAFEILFFLKGGGSVEYLDALIPAVGADDRGLEMLFDKALGVVPFREDDQAARSPGSTFNGFAIRRQPSTSALIFTEPFDEVLNFRVGLGARALGNRGHLLQEFPLGGFGRGFDRCGESGLFGFLVEELGKFVLVERGAFVFGIDGLHRLGADFDVGSECRFLGPYLFHRRAMNSERAGKRLGRRKQALLKLGGKELEV